MKARLSTRLWLNPEASRNPLESYNYSGKRLVVDVGGGRGDLISSIMQANPTLKESCSTYLRELRAQSQLKAKGVADRAKLSADPSSTLSPKAVMSMFSHGFSMTAGR